MSSPIERTKSIAAMQWATGPRHHLQIIATCLNVVDRDVSARRVKVPTRHGKVVACIKTLGAALSVAPRTTTCLRDGKQLPSNRTRVSASPIDMCGFGEFVKSTADVSQWNRVRVDRFNEWLKF